MDDFRNSAGPVVTGSGQLLHAGRIHSHFAGARNRGPADQCDLRQAASPLNRRSRMATRTDEALRRTT